MANDMFNEFNTDLEFVGFLNSIYISSILSPSSIKSSSMDLWGNVKIPYLPKLNDLNSDRWIQILDPAPEYSSLLGIPLGSMESGNTTLSLESTYIGLDCSNPTNGPEVSLLYDPEVPLSNGTFWSVNITTACGGLPPAWIVATDIWRPSDSFPQHFADAKNLEVDQSRLLFESGRGGP